MRKNNNISEVSANDFRKQWKRRFESFASKYNDDASIAGWSVTGLETRFRYFVTWFQAHSSCTGQWLDLGCGAGSYSRYLQGLGCSVIGIDYSMPSILKARERSEGGIFWMVADATQLPFKRHSLDGVICFGVTQALPDSQCIVREACQLVNSDGEIWIDGLNRWFFPYLLNDLRCKVSRKSNKLRYESPLVLKEMLQNEGFGSIRLLWMPMVPGSLNWLQRFLERKFIQQTISFVFPIGALISHGFMLVGRR